MVWSAINGRGDKKFRDARMWIVWNQSSDLSIGTTLALQSLRTYGKTMNKTDGYIKWVLAVSLIIESVFCFADKRCIGFSGMS